MFTPASPLATLAIRSPYRRRLFRRIQRLRLRAAVSLARGKIDQATWRAREQRALALSPHQLGTLEHTNYFWGSP